VEVDSFVSNVARIILQGTDYPSPASELTGAKKRYFGFVGFAWNSLVRLIT
jgi:hypothetical protein